MNRFQSKISLSVAGVIAISLLGCGDHSDSNNTTSSSSSDSMTSTKIPRQIKAERFTLVDKDGRSVLEIFSAAGGRPNMIFFGPPGGANKLWLRINDVNNDEPEISRFDKDGVETLIYPPPSKKK